MKRHFLGFCLAAVLLIGVFCPLARAETPDFPAQALVLMEASTGQVLYEKSAHVQRPCASITKVMTLLLVFESIDAGTLHLDDVLTASGARGGHGRLGHLAQGGRADDRRRPHQSVRGDERE